jgi:hypothetical protein
MQSLGGSHPIFLTVNDSFFSNTISSAPSRIARIFYVRSIDKWGVPNFEDKRDKVTLNDTCAGMQCRCVPEKVDLMATKNREAVRT